MLLSDDGFGCGRSLGSFGVSLVSLLLSQLAKGRQWGKRFSSRHSGLIPRTPLAPGRRVPRTDGRDQGEAMLALQKSLFLPTGGEGTFQLNNFPMYLLSHPLVSLVPGNCIPA